MNEDRVDVDFGADTESPAPFFCSTCGAELSEDMDFCPQCGLQIMPLPSDGLFPPDALLPPNAPQPPSDVAASDSFVWGLLGFFLPLVGLILFLIWMDSKPQSARAAGKGALVRVILAFLLLLLFLSSVGGSLL